MCRILEASQAPTNVSDKEWGFAASHLTLMETSAPQPQHSLREVFNALRWIVRAGTPLTDAADPFLSVGSGLPAESTVG